MKNLHSFSKNKLSVEQTGNTKGGYNIFCEIYIGRQKAKGEAVDSEILSKLMVWDQGLNNAMAKYR